eukprot:1145863-Pelagomonas_calceolata.AAC.3
MQTIVPMHIRAAIQGNHSKNHSLGHRRRHPLSNAQSLILLHAHAVLNAIKRDIPEGFIKLQEGRKCKRHAMKHRALCAAMAQ